jgi:hypothetical protein
VYLSIFGVSTLLKGDFIFDLIFQGIVLFKILLGLLQSFFKILGIKSQFSFIFNFLSKKSQTFLIHFGHINSSHSQVLYNMFHQIVLIGVAIWSYIVVQNHQNHHFSHHSVSHLIPTFSSAFKLA